VALVAVFLFEVPMVYGRGLENLIELRDARSARSSSADPDWRDGNGDAHTLPVGETREIADLQGPGIIRHIWFTFYGHDPKQGRGLILRMYWDESDQPAVECPLGDFFAVGHGGWRTVNSIPVSITSAAKAYNCYWLMPFRKHARITITNDSPYHAGVFWYVYYERLDVLPEQTPYFHAQYRQEYPAAMGRDYLILDTQGRGHYVGTVLSTRFRTTGWYGEGDDRFFIDGANEPTLRGTGTEDYFCDAWGFRQFNRPYYGVTIWDGIDVGDRVTAYRWHIPDPVHFHKSLKVTIEHKGVMEDQTGAWFTNFHERPDLISSVAFWYQTGAAKRFAQIPPYDERIVPTTHIELDDPEEATCKPAGTNMTVQRGTFLGGRQLLANFDTAESKLAYRFTLEEAVAGRARLHMSRWHTYGIWKVTLNGKAFHRVDRADLYVRDKPEQENIELLLGAVDLEAGEHTLEFHCLGKNPASMGYSLAIDALTIEGIDHFRVHRDSDDENEK
jgi:hypothetical protein